MFSRGGVLGVYESYCIVGNNEEVAKNVVAAEMAVLEGKENKLLW